MKRGALVNLRSSACLSGIQPGIYLFQHLSQAHPEPGGYQVKDAEAGIRFSALDFTHVGPVETAVVRERFLRETLFAT